MAPRRLDLCPIVFWTFPHALINITTALAVSERPLDTTLAAVALLNVDDAGDVAPAAAMAMMIFFAATAVRVAYGLVTRGALWRAQG